MNTTQPHTHRHEVSLTEDYDYEIGGCPTCRQPLSRDRTVTDSAIRLLGALGDRTFVIEISSEPVTPDARP